MLLSAYFIYDYLTYMDERDERCVQIGSESLQEVQYKIASILWEVVEEGEKIRFIIENQDLTADEVVELVEERSRAKMAQVFVPVL